jgi:hypothetical protein
MRDSAQGKPADSAPSRPAPAAPAPSIPVPTSLSAPISALPSRTVLPGSATPRPVSELAGEPGAGVSAPETVAAATVPAASENTGATADDQSDLHADDHAPDGAVSSIPLQPRSGERVDPASATSSHDATRPGSEGTRHTGQSSSTIPSEQVAGHENAYTPPADGVSSITVGSHTNTTGALPARRSAHSPIGTASTEGQQNSDEDGEPAPSEAEGTGALETIGGLRRRVRGENLPDTGQDTPVEPAFPRDAAGVRAALSSFKAGRDLANRDS